VLVALVELNEMIEMIELLSCSWRCQSREQLGSRRGISRASGVQVGHHQAGEVGLMTF
jgi:hypothetical protein